MLVACTILRHQHGLLDREVEVHDVLNQAGILLNLHPARNARLAPMQ